MLIAIVFHYFFLIFNDLVTLSSVLGHSSVSAEPRLNKELLNVAIYKLLIV